jgi:hypothetical protein
MKVRCDHAGKLKCMKGCKHREWHEPLPWVVGCGDGIVGVCWEGSACASNVPTYKRVRCLPRGKR